ncbi:MAG TPA: PilZ domain-containing protein [Thermoanaerobaculia bacterium]|nr:PilZ domain-containing protein [Thermoanaerobaculia bacterium]
MSNRREYRRWPRRIQVRFWRSNEGGQAHHGFTSDVSESGAYIVTDTPVGTNSRVRVELFNERGGFFAEAVVRRSQQVHRDLQAVKSSGMGIHFLGIVELMHELLPQAELVGTMPPVDEEPWEAASPATESPSSAPGPGPPQVGRGTEETSSTAGQPATSVSGPPRLDMPIRFRGVEDLRQIYERDLQHGGLFVAMTKPPAVGTRVRMALYLPGNPDPLLADAQVVQVFDAGPRARSRPNLLSGMGVLFDDPARVLERLRPLVVGSGASS